MHAHYTDHYKDNTKPVAFDGLLMENRSRLQKIVASPQENPKTLIFHVQFRKSHRNRYANNQPQNPCTPKTFPNQATFGSKPHMIWWRND
jgi:predicted aminopeptidase